MSWTFEQAVNDLERYVLRGELPAVDSAAMIVAWARMGVIGRPNRARAELTCKMIPFVEEDGSVFIVNCSECGDAIFARGGEHYCNFCPNCGAKVVG